MTTTWQADFHRLPTTTDWELTVCDGETGALLAQTNCPNANATAAWLVAQLRAIADRQTVLPERLLAFRPQTAGLLGAAARQLEIEFVPTRRAIALKQHLQARATELGCDLLTIEQLPPRPLPEDLQGDRWRFASVAAGELELAFGDRPIPFCQMPADLLPLSVGLASTVRVPGLVIDGGRQALRLAQWLQDTDPAALQVLPGETPQAGGVILAAGLSDRWILATYDDGEVARAAANYRQRQAEACGLHFLLVQPDDSGLTYSGFWLLQAI